MPSAFDRRATPGPGHADFAWLGGTPRGGMHSPAECCRNCARGHLDSGRPAAGAPLLLNATHVGNGSMLVDTRRIPPGRSANANLPQSSDDFVQFGIARGSPR